MTEELKKILENAVGKIAGDLGKEIPDGFIVRLERPRQTGHGDWATNIAMQLAKPFGLKPRELADRIIAEIPFGQTVEKPKPQARFHQLYARLRLDNEPSGMQYQRIRTMAESIPAKVGGSRSSL